MKKWKLSKKKILNNGTKHTHKLQNSPFFNGPKDSLKKQNVTFWHMFHSYIYFFGIPIDVQNQHFLIGHVAVMVANYVTTPQTASIAILIVSALTFYTLKSVCIFSILFSRHFLRCQYGEFV